MTGDPADGEAAYVRVQGLAQGATLEELVAGGGWRVEEDGVGRMPGGLLRVLVTPQC